MITQKGAEYLAWCIWWDSVINSNKQEGHTPDELTW